MDESRLAEIKALHWDNSVASAVARELMVAVETAWRERDEERRCSDSAWHTAADNDLIRAKNAEARAARAEAEVKQLEDELSRLEKTIGVYLNASTEDLRRALRRAISAAQDSAR